jgi:AraC-like DNA-binding protein
MREVRVATLRTYVEVAESLGLDGRGMLIRVGIHPDAMKDTENRVPAEAVARLLEMSAQESGCENFGVLLGEKRSLATLGPMSMLLERLPNLREVLRASIAYQRHFNDIADLSFEETDEGCCIRLGLVPGPWPVQMTDLFLVLIDCVLAGAAGGAWRPETVYAARARPADLTPWRRIFTAPIEFDAEFNGFFASHETMDAPLPLADPVMAENALRLVGMVQLGPRPDRLAERVRRALGPLLPDGRANVAAVAKRLGMSQRTLQRRLEAEELRFDALLDEVRRDLAASYLSQTSRQISTIASMLGYASPSSFSRWFAGVFGKAPHAWREEKRKERDRSVAGAAGRRRGSRA